MVVACYRDDAHATVKSDEGGNSGVLHVREESGEILKHQHKHTINHTHAKTDSAAVLIQVPRLDQADPLDAPWMWWLGAANIRSL